MDRYRYFIFNQKGVLGLGILQVACAGLCVVCGLMDAVFRKDTPLSTTRTPLWGGLVRLTGIQYNTNPQDTCLFGYKTERVSSLRSPARILVLSSLFF